LTIAGRDLKTLTGKAPDAPRGDSWAMRFLGWAAIILLGALVLCPAVAYFDFTPLPGDIHVDFGNGQVYLPLGSSLAASVVLTLLFWLLRK
jgi:hypothetical protein